MPANASNIQIKSLAFPSLQQAMEDQVRLEGSRTRGRYNKASSIVQSTITVNLTEGETPPSLTPPPLRFSEQETAYYSGSEDPRSQYEQCIISDAKLVLIFVDNEDPTEDLIASITRAIPSYSATTQVVGFRYFGLPWHDNALRRTLDNILFLEFRHYYHPTDAPTLLTDHKYLVECYELQWSSTRRAFIGVIGTMLAQSRANPVDAEFPPTRATPSAASHRLDYRARGPSIAKALTTVLSLLAIFSLGLGLFFLRGATKLPEDQVLQPVASHVEHKPESLGLPVEADSKILNRSSKHWSVRLSEVSCSPTQSFFTLAGTLQYTGPDGVVEPPTVRIRSSDHTDYRIGSAASPPGSDLSLWLLSADQAVVPLNKLSSGATLGQFLLQFDLPSTASDIVVALGDIQPFRVIDRGHRNLRELCQALDLKHFATPSASNSQAGNPDQTISFYNGMYPCRNPSGSTTLTTGTLSPHAPKQLVVLGRRYLPNMTYTVIDGVRVPTQTYMYKGEDSQREIEEFARAMIVRDFPQYSSPMMLPSDGNLMADAYVGVVLGGKTLDEYRRIFTVAIHSVDDCN